MSAKRGIEIVGGGLAGLGLGLALQRRGIETTIFEAGSYPRHRVCGEFIAGLKASTIETLGLRPILSEARPLQEVSWFSKNRLVRQQTLEHPALALSRFALDARLATAFVEAGGQLRTRERVDESVAPPGRVFANGRRRACSPWIGLKLHARGIELQSDLEFHLGEDAYAGVSSVENGEINVCGLFRRKRNLHVSRSSALSVHLRAAGLDSLAERLDRANIDEKSFSAVAGFGFQKPEPDKDRISLGDHFAMIPPYTGNGMAIAFQTAECALLPLQSWSENQTEWAETVRTTMRAIRQRLDRRLLLASQLHGFMLSPVAQTFFNWANQSRLLPLRRIASALHQ